MSQLARHAFSFADYVELEEASVIKHEFLDGVVYAMAGRSPAHAGITSSVIRLLGTALEGQRCRVFTSDLRVRVEQTGLGTYPDASVVCGGLQLDPADAKGHTVLNPTVVVEVLSPSTEDYDRGEKLAHYKRIAALQEVVLVAHDERRIDVWRRQGDRWTQVSYGPEEALHLASLHITVAVAEVYRDPLSA